MKSLVLRLSDESARGKLSPCAMPYFPECVSKNMSESKGAFIALYCYHSKFCDA